MMLQVTAATPCTVRRGRDLRHERRVTHELAEGQRALGRQRRGQEKKNRIRKDHNEV